MFQKIFYLSTFILLTIVLFDRLLHYTWSYSSLGVSYFFSMANTKYIVHISVLIQY